MKRSVSFIVVISIQLSVVSFGFAQESTKGLFLSWDATEVADSVRKANPDSESIKHGFRFAFRIRVPVPKKEKNIPPITPNKKEKK